MLAKLDIWILIFVAAATQGLFLFIVILLKNRQKEKSQYALAALIAAFTLTLSSYIIFWIGLSQKIPNLFGVGTQLTFLFGPLLWFYLNLVERKSFTIDLKHFIPFFAVIVLIPLNVYFLRQPYFGIGISVFQCSQLVFYTTLIFSFTKHRKSNTYIQYIALSFLAYTLCFCGYYIMVWIGAMKIEYDYAVSLAMAFFIYFLGYRGYALNAAEQKVSMEEKYANSSLSPAALASIESVLDKKMTEEKYFLNGNLKIQDVSKAIEVNLHSLSQTINVTKQKSFNDYINELRINEAKRLINEASYENEKLLAIAIDSGFNNKTSFLNAFKKFTGKTPSEYRKSLDPELKSI
uniref:helix-turn-helix domain-containing protein n=3 Tax=Roseivirga sp. TaxID=1964215 RepID=UPI0040489B7E